MIISPNDLSQFEQLRHNPWRWTALHCVAHWYVISGRRFDTEAEYPHCLILTSANYAMAVHFDKQKNALFPNAADQIGSLTTWNLWRTIPKSLWPKQYKELTSTNCDICSFLLHPDQRVRELGELLKSDQNLEDALKEGGWIK